MSAPTAAQAASYRRLSRQLLAGGYGIDSVSYEPPVTVTVFHAPAATQAQRDGAQAAIAAWNWASEPEPAEMASDEIFTLDGETRRFPNLAALFVRRAWFQYARTPADRTTTSTAAVNVLPLSFNVEANEEWTFSLRLRVGSSNTSGLKVALIFPVGASLRATAKGNSGAKTTINAEQITASGTLGATWCAAAINDGWLEIDGVIVTGETAGAVQLQAAKVTSGTATIFQGSYVDAQRKG